MLLLTLGYRLAGASAWALPTETDNRCKLFQPSDIAVPCYKTIKENIILWGNCHSEHLFINLQMFFHLRKWSSKILNGHSRCLISDIFLFFNIIITISSSISMTSFLSKMLRRFDSTWTIKAWLSEYINEWMLAKETCHADGQWSGPIKRHKICWLHLFFFNTHWWI